MKPLFTLIAAAFVAGPALAADAGMELAQKKNCLACHDVATKKVGPAYKDVAAKYKADKTAEAKLAEKVIKGGTGVWGQVPMPANNVTPDEAKTLVKWVLSQK